MNYENEVILHLAGSGWQKSYLNTVIKYIGRKSKIIRAYHSCVQ